MFALKLILHIFVGFESSFNEFSNFPIRMAIAKLTYEINIQVFCLIIKRMSIDYSENWKDELLDHIDADQLPVYYGGTATDENGDPKCSAHVIFVS